MNSHKGLWGRILIGALCAVCCLAPAQVAPVRRMPTASKSYFSSKRAIVLNTNGGVCTVMSGGRRNKGLLEGDRIVYARRTSDGILIVGKGLIERAYDTDSEGVVLNEQYGVHPEDEVYVLNRSSSPYSITKLRL